MERIQSDELQELKIELVTVVETLNILHDFIDSVFGPKFRSFYKTQGQPRSPQTALRDLRWKYFNLSNNEVSESCSGRNPAKACESLSRDSPSRLPGMIGSPEVINLRQVKLEVDCEEDVPDFLEDVDPFGGDGEGESATVGFHNDSGSHYATGFDGGGESELKITSYQTISDQVRSPSSRHTSSSSQNRFVPGLIPILHDSLVHQRDIDFDVGSSPNPSESSDEWHPSLEACPPPSRRKTKTPSKRRRARKPFSSSLQSQIKSEYDQTPSNISHNKQSRSDTGGGNEGGAFKCNLCPASYKQEDSLKSHQKYKHNPSRVQCTCHLCGKSMVDKYRLQRHLRLHTGEKPFSCQYCGQRFYRKDYHTKHMQRKHGLCFPQSSSTSSSTSVTTRGNKSHQTKKLEMPRISKPLPVLESPLASANMLPNTSITNSLSQQSNPNPSSSIGTMSETPPSSASKDTNSFVDYFSSSNSMPNSNLVTIASLTFDDLISADL